MLSDKVRQILSSEESKRKYESYDDRIGIGMILKRRSRSMPVPVLIREYETYDDIIIMASKIIWILETDAGISEISGICVITEKQIDAHDKYYGVSGQTIAPKAAAIVGGVLNDVLVNQYYRDEIGEDDLIYGEMMQLTNVLISCLCREKNGMNMSGYEYIDESSINFAEMKISHGSNGAKATNMLMRYGGKNQKITQNFIR